MLELIDRQAALEIAMCYCPDDDGSCLKAGHDIREMLDEIETLPTIEVKPVQKPKMYEIDRKKCEEWCKDCEHIEMCAWYPFGGCDFRLLPKPEVNEDAGVRLIDANALKKDLSEFNYEMALRIVDTQPTIKPEVRRGRWIAVSAFDACGGDEEVWMAHGNPTAYHYCSECKNETYLNEEGKEILSDYCPFCGADMREEGASNEQV